MPDSLLLVEIVPHFLPLRLIYKILIAPWMEQEIKCFSMKTTIKFTQQIFIVFLAS